MSEENIIEARTKHRFPVDQNAKSCQAASANLSDERVRVRDEADGTYTIVLPGEPGYDQGDRERENGWVRLRPVR